MKLQYLRIDTPFAPLAHDTASSRRWCLNVSIILWLLVLLVPIVVVHGQGPSHAGSDFWKHWGDGRAELNAYALSIPRYGQMRTGTAVAIFVTEDFDNHTRVKSNTPATPDNPDVFPVIKLNLVKDFPTGIYDYNMMTSVFVPLRPANGYPAGSATKISFSAQEWCGHVYQQLRFDRDKVRHQLHSYFQGEADQDQTLDAQPSGLSEDALLLWARRLAGPPVPPGQPVTVPILRSLEIARLQHLPLLWDQVVIARSDGSTSITVPAGTFEVETCQATITRTSAKKPDQRTWTIHVEASYPHRVIQWSTSDGQVAKLLGSARLPYWQMNGQGQQEALRQIGLDPR